MATRMIHTARWVRTTLASKHLMAEIGAVAGEIGAERMAELTSLFAAFVLVSLAPEDYSGDAIAQLSSDLGMSPNQIANLPIQLLDVTVDELRKAVGRLHFVFAMTDHAR